MKNILIVEDHKDLREMLCEALSEKFEIEVFEDETGKGAAFTLGTRKIDLVISDFNMPFGTGEWLHSHMKRFKMKIPLILFTTDLGPLPTEDEILKAIIPKHDMEQLIQLLTELGLKQKLTGA